MFVSRIKLCYAIPFISLGMQHTRKCRIFACLLTHIKDYILSANNDMVIIQYNVRGTNAIGVMVYHTDKVVR